jgi:hypothetical protein
MERDNRLVERERERERESEREREKLTVRGKKGVELHTIFWVARHGKWCQY